MMLLFLLASRQAILLLDQKEWFGQGDNIMQEGTYPFQNFSMMNAQVQV